MEKLPPLNSIEYKVYSIWGKSLLSSFLHTAYTILHTNRDGFIKFTRRSLSILLILAILLPTLSYFFLFRTDTTEAAWFDDTWSYRQRVDITNGGSAQTDYQISITVNTSTLITASKMQSDCDDIRVTDMNGKVLPHWIEESNPGCNQTTTKVWTKIPSIATTGGAVFVYYGNPAAVNVENPNQVFIFFDNFSGDLSRWTVSHGGSCAASITSGVLQITANTTCDGTPFYVSNGLGNLSDAAGYAFDFRGKFSSGGSGRLQMYQRYRSSLNYEARFWLSGANTYYQEQSSAGWSGVTDIGNSGAAADTWYNYGVKVTGSSNQLFVNGTSIGTATASSGDVISKTDFTVGLGQYQTIVQYDNARVRKSATTEPSVAAPTNEEKAPSPIAYWKFDEGKGAIASNSQYKSSGTITNMVTNPSFENDLTGYTYCQTATCTRSSDYAIHGAYSTKAVNTGGGQSLVGQNSPERTTVSPNTTYTASFWAYSTTGGRTVGQYIIYWTSGDVYVGEDGGGYVTLPANTWVRVTRTFTTGATVGKVNLRPQWHTGVQVGEAFYVDGLQLETGSATSNYCDGSLTGNGTRSWSGTAHASTSTCSSGSDGQISGTTWQPEDQCISGKCLRFDGTNGVVTTGDVNDLDVTEAITLSVWYKEDVGAGSNRWLIDKGPVNTSYALFLESGLKFRINGGNDCIVTEPSEGVWHHAVVTYDRSTAKIYVDGVLQTTCVRTDALVQTATGVRIGMHSGPGYAFKGLIDDVKIYGYALSAAQVKANYVAKTGGEGGSVLGASSNSNLSNGLVGYWKMDETAANTCTGGVNDSCDSSGNTNNGAWNGNTANTTGKFGNGTSYDGTGDYIDAGNNSSVQLSGAGTVAAWINCTDCNSQDHVIAKDFTDDRGWALGIQSARIYFESNGNSVITTGTTFSASTWTHIAVTCDGTTCKAFVNGSESASVANAGFNSQTTSSLSIGRRNYTGSEQYFMGSIDEARVYNRALSPNEVSQLFNFAPGPMAYWKFDEKSGTTAVDSSGSGLTGTFSGDTTWDTGKYGGSVKMDGTSDYINVGTGNSLTNNINDLSVGAWVKLNRSLGANSTNYEIISNESFQVRGWLFRVEDTTNPSTAGKIHFRFSTSGASTYLTATSQSFPNDQQWHYVAATKTGTVGKIYVDGVEKVLDANLSLTPPTNSTTNTHIGGNGQHFFGNIDELKVYNYGRTAKQVVEDMNAGHPAPGSPVSSPFAYYKLDEGYSSTANNSGSSGSVLNGSITGATWTNAGKFGKALNFDGSGDRVTDSDNAFIPTNITVSAWFKPTTLVDTAGIVSAYWWEEWGSVRVRSTGAIEWAFYDASTTYRAIASSAGVVTVGSWHHVAATFDKATQQTKLYLNGVQVASGTSPDIERGTTTNDMYIGTHFRDSAFFDFNGAIDEVKIYSSALTADQIKMDMNRGQAQVLGASEEETPKTIGNVALWLDANATNSITTATGVSQWNDKSGNGRHVTQATGSKQPSYVTNTLNGKPVVRFTASASQTMTNSTNFAAPASVVYVVRQTGGANQRMLSGLNNNWLLGYWGGAKQQAYFDGWVSASSTPATDTSWHIYSSVHTGSLSTAWEDGTQYASNANGLTGPNGVSLSGIGGTSEFSNGDIAEVLIFNKALSTSEREKVEGYLAGKWGLQSSLASAHSYKTTAPSSASQSGNSEYCIPGDSNDCNAPIGRWDFEEGSGTTANDKSGNGYSLTNFTNTPTYTSGKLGKGINFVGSSSQMVHSSTTNPNMGSGSWTIEYWMKSPLTSGNQGHIRKGNGSFNTSGVGWEFRTQGTQLELARGNGSGTPNRAQAILTANVWNHIVGVYNSSNTTLYLYVNGAQVSSVSSTSTYTDSYQLEVGHGADGYFTGQIDSVHIFNYVRTPAQVAWDYNKGAPIAHWKFDECQGTTANDSSGNGNSATVTIGGSGTQTSAGTCTGSANTAWRDGVSGKRNYSLDFDGTDDWVTRADDSDFDFNSSTSFSFGAWVKTTTGSKFIMSKRDTGPAAGYSMEINGNGYVIVTVEDTPGDGATELTSSSAQNIADGSWHLVTAVLNRSDNTLKHYIDGNLMNSTNVSTIGDVSNSRFLSIGANNGSPDAGTFWNGQIDDARIYNYALTATQVKQLYSGSAVNFAPVTGAP